MIGRRLLLISAVCALAAGLRAPSALAQDEAPASPEEEAGEAEIEARLTRIEGSVYLHLHDHKEGEFIEGELDAPLSAGDIIRTGSDGMAEIAFNGDSILEVSKDSDFIINSLDPQETEFHLGIGGLVAKLRSLLPGARLEFHTPEAVASVRGTELAVEHEGDGKPSRIGVFDEGHVAVRAQGGALELPLGPDQETDVRRSAGPGEARKLTHFAQRRQRLELLRRRLEFFRTNWIRRTQFQRRQRRARLLRKKIIRAQRLRNVRADRLRRVYRDIRRRQAELTRRRTRRIQAEAQRRRRQRKLQEQSERLKKARKKKRPGQR